MTIFCNHSIFSSPWWVSSYIGRTSVIIAVQSFGGTARVTCCLHTLAVIALDLRNGRGIKHKNCISRKVQAVMQRTQTMFFFLGPLK